MKIRFFSLFAARITALLSLLLASVATPAEPPPVQQDAVGKKAWTLLGAFYRNDTDGSNNLDTTMDTALLDLEGGAPDKAADAAALLLAVFRQAAADERNGRAQWHLTPYWGGGPESEAQNYRKGLAARFGKSATSDAALPVAEWLLREDSLADSQNAAVAVIERCHKPASDHSILTILENGTHFRPAIIMALQQTAKRKLNAKPEDVRKWTLDPRLSVRTAAEEARKAIGA